MAVRDIRLLGDPVLRTPCEEITKIDDQVRELIQDLIDTTDMEGRAGVAANQIGVSLRAFSLNIEGKVDYIINPKIVKLSKELQTDIEEGCLSIPEKWYLTIRAEKARCEGIDLDGKKKVIEGVGLLARALQHECDHLDGHLYIDRLKGSEKRKMRSELFN
ncbi:MAG: peptide deformylase [Bifidobacteriaceae bacterium]|jgi:peptide deformylase|nr:peptide deformylase [Bifidobacteriaceae bacterium]